MSTGYDAGKSLVEQITGFAGTTNNSTSSRTGVVRPVLDPYMARVRYLQERGVGGAGQIDTSKIFTAAPAPPPSGGFGGTLNYDWDKILGEYNKPYGELTKQLADLTARERLNIQNVGARAGEYLRNMDPMAGYRPTFAALEAPTAASAGYLNAIGASPAQVEAQRNLLNQLMSSQATSQSQFSNAVDASQTNFRLAQLAEMYANQQAAESRLGQTEAQNLTQLELRRIADINAIRKMIMDFENQKLAIQMEASNRMAEIRAKAALNNQGGF